MGERDRAGLVGTDLFSYVGSQRARARERSYHGAMTEGEVRPLTHTPKACCPLLAIQAAASQPGTAGQIAAMQLKSAST